MKAPTVQAFSLVIRDIPSDADRSTTPHTIHSLTSLTLNAGLERRSVCLPDK